MLNKIISIIAAFLTGFIKAKQSDATKTVKRIKKANKASIGAYNPDERERLRNKYN